MKPYVIGFVVGFILAGMLCAVPRHIDGSYQRMSSPATLVQWTTDDNEWREPIVREFDGIPFTLPPVARFKPAPPIYNWQNPCP